MSMVMPTSMDLEDDLFDANGAWRSPVADWTDPLRSADAGRMRAALESGISRLPPQQSRAYSLREMEGLDIETVCSTMQITADQLALLLHRARLRLHELLERGDFKPG